MEGFQDIMCGMEDDGVCDQDEKEAKTANEKFCLNMLQHQGFLI